MMNGEWKRKELGEGGEGVRDWKTVNRCRAKITGTLSPHVPNPRPSFARHSGPLSL